MAIFLDRESAKKILDDFPDSFTEKERRRIKRRSPNKKKPEKASSLKGLKYGRTIVITANDIRQPVASVMGRY